MHADNVKVAHFNEWTYSISIIKSYVKIYTSQSCAPDQHLNYSIFVLTFEVMIKSGSFYHFEMQNITDWVQ